MLKRFRRFIKYLFKVDQIGPDFSVYGVDTMPVDELQRERNKDAREREALNLQRSIANMNAASNHRNIIIAFIGIAVALLVGLAGIILNLRQKPPIIQIVSPKSVQVKQ